MYQLLFLVLICLLAYFVIRMLSNPRTWIGSSEETSWPKDPTLDQMWSFVKQILREAKSPTKADFYVDNKPISKRILLNREYGLWSFPTEKTISDLAKFINKNSTGVLSVGAGRGLWEVLLSRKSKVPIIAVDKTISAKGTFYPVEQYDITSEEFQRYCDRLTPRPNVVFSAWPDYNNDSLTKFLMAYKPEYLIYVGEGENGCTGDESLHHLLSQSELVKKVDYPRWGRMYDDCKIFRLKN